MVGLLIMGCGSKLPVATLDVAGHSVKAEIAATDDSRQRGLMFRDSMGTDDGMLFVYEDQQVRHFWMKDTRIPLSIAFANREGVIVRIEDMKPFDTETRTSSLVPATYALEMNQGWFAKNGVEKGAVITGIPEGLTVE